MSLINALVSALLVLSSFLDVEALAELTDLNAASMALVLAATFGVTLDLIFRSLSGQIGEVDSGSANYLLSYSTNLVYYFFLILIAFYSHVLSPLSSYLVGGAEGEVILSASLGLSFGLLASLLMIAESGMSLSLSGSASVALTPVGDLAFSLLAHALYLGLILSSLVLTSSSLFLSLGAEEAYDLSGGASALYEGGGEQAVFEWHLAQTGTFTYGLLSGQTVYSLVFWISGLAVATPGLILSVVGLGSSLPASSSDRMKLFAVEVALKVLMVTLTFMSLGVFMGGSLNPIYF